MMSQEEIKKKQERAAIVAEVLSYIAKVYPVLEAIYQSRRKKQLRKGSENLTHLTSAQIQQIIRVFYDDIDARNRDDPVGVTYLLCKGLHDTVKVQFPRLQ